MLSTAQPSKRGASARIVGLLGRLLLILSIMTTAAASDMIATAAANDSAWGAVCYYDYPPLDKDYDDTTIHCHGSNWQRCPFGAVCKGGLLRECADDLLTEAPASVHDIPQQKTCVLSTQSKRTIAAIRKLLHEWTVADLCQPGGNPYTIVRYYYPSGDSTARPFFLDSQLAGELKMEYDWKLIELANTHGVGDELLFVGAWWGGLRDGNRTILGLHPLQRLELPGTCSAKLAVFSIFGIDLKFYSGNSRGKCLEKLFSSIVVPGVGWIIVWLLHNRRMRQEERRTMQTDRINIRQQVYRLLMADPHQDHAALHLRNTILFHRNMPYDELVGPSSTMTLCVTIASAKGRS